MLVNLTDSGLKLLGELGRDRRIQKVSDDRAYALMSGEYAAPDTPWMALYLKKHPGARAKADGKKEKKTKETAESRKAKSREKAITEDK